MKVLDLKLENSPSHEDVRDMAELRIRNLLCFKELQYLNDKGTFANEHPFLVHRIELAELKALWNADRNGFIREYNNCKVNIRRYRGRINQSDISEEDKEKYMTLLLKHQNRENIFKEIINYEPSSNHL